MGFLLFLFLIVMVRTSNTMLNKSAKNGHPCLVPDLRGNALSFSWLSVLAVGLSCMAFIIWGMFPLCPLFGIFKVINRCWILSKAFSAPISEYHLFFILQFVNMVYHIVTPYQINTLIDLWILKSPYICGINSTWSWCMILLLYCWIQFASILLRIFTSVFISDIGL